MSPALEAAIRSNPEDPRAWAVYGDWLEAQGDPRGTLVGLMLAREEAPSAALAKAVNAFLQANASWLLGPELAKPGVQLAWRRGFLASAHVTELAALRELLAHPSARFLDHLGIHAATNLDAADWCALLSGDGFPSAHVVERTVAETVLAWPRLRRADVELPYRDPAMLPWANAKVLRSLRLRRPNPDVLHALLQRPPPALEELRLWECQASLVDVLAEYDLSRLKVVTADGEHSPEGLDLLAAALRPKKLVLCMAPDAEARLAAELPGVSSWVQEEREETALVVLDAPALSGEARTVLERLAQKSGCSQFVAFTNGLKLVHRDVTVCRFHGDDTSASLLPLILAHELTKALGVRTAVVTLSESNDLAKALCFGVAAEPPPKGEKRKRPRVELAAAHKVEGGRYHRRDVTRDVVGRILGVDPGPDALDALLRALDESLPVTLHGPRFTSGMPLPPLLTEEPANEEPVDDEEDEYDEDEENAEAWEDEWDTVVGPDEAPPQVDDGVPDREPSRIDVPLTVTLPVVEVEEEEEGEDPDEHVPDLVDADEGEIWNEGPVDPEEEWTIPEDPPPPAEPDPEQLSAEQAEVAVAPSCVRCGTLAETTPCRLCFDELCEVCLPPGERRVCPQCVPL